MMFLKVLIALGSLFSLLMSLAALFFILLNIFLPADHDGMVVAALWDRLKESLVIIILFLFFFGAAVAGIRYCYKTVD